LQKVAFPSDCHYPFLFLTGRSFFCLGPPFSLVFLLSGIEVGLLPCQGALGLFCGCSPLLFPAGTGPPFFSCEDFPPPFSRYGPFSPLAVIFSLCCVPPIHLSNHCTFPSLLFFFLGQSLQGFSQSPHPLFLQRAISIFFTLPPLRCWFFFFFLREPLPARPK